MARILHIIHSQDGTVVAASESKHHARPVSMEGLVVGEFEVPAQFDGKNLREYSHLLSVDVAKRRLRQR